MPLTPRQIDSIRRMEAPDPEMLAILEQKTPAERLAIANGMWRSAREIYRNMIRAEHPDWSIEQVHCAAAQRLASGSE
jgi:hypothetical protein